MASIAKGDVEVSAATVNTYCVIVCCVEASNSPPMAALR
jgi:hypothetical protein